MYLIITLNGRGVQFEADRVVEFDEKYVFYLEEEIVAEFLVKGICGYCKLEVDDEED